VTRGILLEVVEPDEAEPNYPQQVIGDEAHEAMRATVYSFTRRLRSEIMGAAVEETRPRCR